MPELKLTKNELRAQQKKLGQLEKYLPTLQLKKAMLQAEVGKARQEIQQLTQDFEEVRLRVETSSALLSRKTIVNPNDVARVKTVRKQYENYAGVEVPSFVGVDFEEVTYGLMETPPWIDGMIIGLREIATAQVMIHIAREKKAALEEELRQVSIRVNLFEKVLIPRSRRNISRIRIFLGDQELAAVGRAKVAKGKIEALRLQTSPVSEESSYAY